MFETGGSFVPPDRAWFPPAIKTLFVHFQTFLIMKVYASFDFKSSLNDAGLAQFAVNVWTRMTDAPRFAGIKTQTDNNLKPALDRFAAVVQEAADGSRVKIAEKKMRRAELVEVLETLAGHVSIIAGSDPSILLEAGFSVRGKSGRVAGADIGQVQGLQVTAGARSGEAVLTFDPVPRALVYAAEWSADNGQSWHNGTYSSARRTLLQGVPARSDVAFRVTAIGAAQRKGAPSAMVSQFIL